MSWRRETVVTVAALVVLSVAVPAVLAISEVRDRQALAEEAQELSAQVPARQAPADYDGDGRPDATDTCPTRPETTNDFQDDDGCPDVVATTGAS